jgi:hypothetical protein
VTEEGKKNRSEKSERVGRPNLPVRRLRNKRLVTFVTDEELQYLKRVAKDEDRSMASLLYKIINSHIRES